MGNGETQAVGRRRDAFVGEPSHGLTVDNIFVGEIVSKRSLDERSDIRDSFLPPAYRSAHAGYGANLISARSAVGNVFVGEIIGGKMPVQRGYRHASAAGDRSE
jgi:hypothetical protein